MSYLAITLITLLIIFLTSFTINCYTTWLCKPIGIKYSLKQVIVVFIVSWVGTLKVNHWNPIMQILMNIRMIKRESAKKHTKALTSMDIEMGSVLSLPEVVLNRILSEVETLEDFTGFEHNLLWVIPALFKWNPMDAQRTRCPFELTAAQRGVVVGIYKRAVIEEMDKLSGDIRQLLHEGSADTPIVYAAYRRLGLDGYNKKTTQHYYQLPDWSHN